jgi:DNA-binding GntR family transcriptional regulator
MAFKASDSLPGLLAAEICEKIIRNELKPGERILESNIASSKGLSRSPVREALRILEKNRLVELIPRKGARVTALSAEQAECFYDVFEVLYALVARKASQHATQEDKDALFSAMKKIETAAGKGDVDGYFDGIFAFAAAGMKAARNPLLENLLGELWPNNRRFQYASLSKRMEDLKANARFFQEMFRHLTAGEAQKLEETVREYARNEKTFVLRMTAKDETEAGGDFNE